MRVAPGTFSSSSFTLRRPLHYSTFLYRRFFQNKKVLTSFGNCFTFSSIVRRPPSENKNPQIISDVQKHQSPPLFSLGGKKPPLLQKGRKEAYPSKYNNAPVTLLFFTERRRGRRKNSLLEQMTPLSLSLLAESARFSSQFY